MTSFFVPGRIEVLGKHTDYAGGRSLLCAIERGFEVHCAPRTDSQVCVTDDVRNDSFTTAIAPDAAAPRGSWGSYVAAVTRRIGRDFPDAGTGADIRFRSNLPADAGLSSSSALVVAIALALIETNNLDEDPSFRTAFPRRTDLAGYLGAVENGRPFGAFPGDEGVGTFGGSEDHTAILCCRRGVLSQYSFAPVIHEQDVEMASDLVFVIASSGVTANKTGGALEHYNRLSRLTSTLLTIWNGATSRRDATLARALDSSTGAHDHLRALTDAGSRDGFTPAELRSRLDQFAEESLVLVPRASAAFQARDHTTLGALVDRSHQRAVDDLGNQVPETITLQRLARSHGALAASAFGGGFGGSVWALVRLADSHTFLEEWRRRYAQACPATASRSVFFVTPASDGARRLP